jgi:hypothetical protein
VVVDHQQSATLVGLCRAIRFERAALALDFDVTKRAEAAGPRSRC